MGLHVPTGKFAVLTNCHPDDRTAPLSRGSLVSQYLTGESDTPECSNALQFGGFNLLWANVYAAASDLCLRYLCNRNKAGEPVDVPVSDAAIIHDGVHVVVSGHPLDVQIPHDKVGFLRTGLLRLLSSLPQGESDEAISLHALIRGCESLLCDMQRKDFGPPVFLPHPEFGTRSQTIVIRTRCHLHYLFRSTDDVHVSHCFPSWRHWKIDVESHQVVAQGFYVAFEANQVTIPQFSDQDIHVLQ
eukprot:TRINITY_DN479_c0_g1_i1.p1 TRINITY_DN479_c0_g1~~TRINITY_DN479_c0_g1_i1.p1  ORF type:complete len:244 (-),score=16.77 TRINITY_DN479_c0_g1_i1:666-1397(-)